MADLGVKGLPSSIDGDYWLLERARLIERLPDESRPSGSMTTCRAEDMTTFDRLLGEVVPHVRLDPA